MARRRMSKSDYQEAIRNSWQRFFLFLSMTGISVLMVVVGFAYENNLMVWSWTFAVLLLVILMLVHFRLISEWENNHYYRNYRSERLRRQARA